MKNIVVVGASGFLGENLIRDLLSIGSFKIIATTQSKSKCSYIKELNSDLLNFVEVDLTNKIAIQEIIPPKSVVINLAYNWSKGQLYNIRMIENLVDVAAKAKVSRFIHVSTAAVVGRVVYDLVTEETKCNPLTEYGITKLIMEKIVRKKSEGVFDAVIIRPTSIFGPGAAPIRKLAEDIQNEVTLKNYIKSCLFGFRRMNLVSVKNVTASIIFFINYKYKFNGDLYIVSDDDELKNNFVDVEKKLMKKLSIPYYRFHFIAPNFFIKFFLFCMRRNNTNTNANYSSEKLFKLGFKKQVTFEQSLESYCEWLRRSKR